MGNVTGSSNNQTGFCMPYVDEFDYCAVQHYEQIFKRAAQVGMQFTQSNAHSFQPTSKYLATS